MSETKTVTCDIASAGPICFGRAIQSIKNTGESHDGFEQRTWRERLHIDNKGEVFIPPLALKNTLANVAKFLSETVPGKRNATYTKHFLAGILVVQPLMLGVKGKDVEGVRMHVPSDGRKGGTTRVYRTFPVVQEWESKAEIILLDPLLVGKPEKVEEYLIHAGKFIGLLAMRPQTGGYYGRFTIENFKVE